ncbi:hypothetical protein [Methanosarcina sp. MTP4]|uniref:hypothetical protein n=1 Tax=Methanosarcina sp. MTP4 TaxID=1434100 RepID=UPI00064E6E36|nr:hypothetical protein [Methanosarcina sp. MTP4]
MVNENDSCKNINGGTGITAGGDVSVSNKDGLIAIGSNITQSQTIPSLDFEKLGDDLLAFKEAISRSDISTEDKQIIEGDISAAIKEAKREEPMLSKIVDRFESAIEVIEETKRKIEDTGILNLAAKIATTLGINLILS